MFSSFRKCVPARSPRSERKAQAKAAQDTADHAQDTADQDTAAAPRTALLLGGVAGFDRASLAKTATKMTSRQGVARVLEGCGTGSDRVVSTSAQPDPAFLTCVGILPRPCFTF